MIKKRTTPEPNQDERRWLAELEARVDAIEASWDSRSAWQDSFWQRLLWLLRGC